MIEALGFLALMATFAFWLWHRHHGRRPVVRSAERLARAERRRKRRLLRRLAR